MSAKSSHEAQHPASGGTYQAHPASGGASQVLVNRESAFRCVQAWQSAWHYTVRLRDENGVILECAHPLGAGGIAPGVDAVVTFIGITDICGRCWVSVRGSGDFSSTTWSGELVQMHVPISSPERPGPASGG